jgi:hypothetical protein
MDVMIPTEYYKVIRREPYLVCYWRLNDLSGTRAIDWAGKYNLNGIYDGSPSSDQPLINNDIAAGSKLFGAESQNVEIPNATPLQLAVGVGIEFWILPLAAAQTCSLIGKMNAAFTFPNPYRIGLENGKVIFSLGNGINKTSVLSSSILPVSIPSYIVATSFRNKLKIFINGIENVSSSLGLQEVKDGGQPIYVGEAGNNTSRFNGMLGEISLYSEAIGSSEIKNHFGIGRQIIYKKPYFTNFDRPSYSL